MSKLRVGLLITGNEILSGKTKDTNGPFIGMHLRKLGIPIKASMMCGDSRKDLLECLQFLAKRCNVIMMTGGLGPTSDDLTAEVVANFFDLKTAFFEEAWQNCLQAFRKLTHVKVPESNKKQAYLPEGSQILANKVGTAVGFQTFGKVNNRKVVIYCMPGVPYEMEPMFLNEVYPQLYQQSYPPQVKCWQVFGLGESAMQTAIADAEKKLEEFFPTSAISYQAHPGLVTYTVSLFPTTDQEGNKCQSYLENEFSKAVKTAFHKHILYEKELPLVQYLVESLRHKRTSLCFVEASCGGTLTKQLSQIKFAEEIMTGSIVLHGGKEKKYSLSNSLWDDLPKLKQFEFMKADIALTEWGSPALELATPEIPHGQFYVVLSLNPQKIRDAQGLQSRLESFSWKKLEDDPNNSRLNFMNEFQVSTRFDKPTQQLRVTLMCLSSLAMVVSYL